MVTQSHWAKIWVNVASEKSNAARIDLPVICLVFASLIQRGEIDLMLVHVCNEKGDGLIKLKILVGIQCSERQNVDGL